MISQSAMRDCGSSPEVGSSRNRIRGRWTMLRATMRRWAIPPESVATSAFARSDRRKTSSISVATRLRLSGAHAEVPAVEVEVLPDGQAAVERVGLRDDAHHRLGLRRVSDDVDAGDGRGALGGDHAGREHAHRGGLARAVGAQQAEDLALHDLQVEPIDGLDARVVDLREAFGADHHAIGHGDQLRLNARLHVRLQRLLAYGRGSASASLRPFRSGRRRPALPPFAPSPSVGDGALDPRG